MVNSDMETQRIKNCLNRFQQFMTRKLSISPAVSITL